MKQPWLLLVLAVVLGSLWLLPLVDSSVSGRTLPVLCLIGFVLIRALVNGDSLASNDTGIMAAEVGLVLLAGGICFLALSGVLYFVGRLDVQAALPVVMVAGCFMVVGIVALSQRGKDGAGSSGHESAD